MPDAKIKKQLNKKIEFQIQSNTFHYMNFTSLQLKLLSLATSLNVDADFIWNWF